MITSPNVSYVNSEMNPSFVVATAAEPKDWAGDSPFGFDCLDAPECIAAGSIYSYEYALYRPGTFTPMPSHVGRGE